MIIAGDFNSKSTQFGCRSSNSNGDVLLSILEENNLFIVNDNTPTHNSFNLSSFDILDLFLCSSNLVDKAGKFAVHQDNMLSDHFPVEVIISESYVVQTNIINKKFNYNKADWELYNQELESGVIDSSAPLDLQWDQMVGCMLGAAEKSIPYKTSKIYKSTLPPDIIILIKERTKARRKADSKDPADKRAFNKLTALVKQALRKHRDSDWENFLEKMGPNPLSSRPFWQKINKFRGKASNSRLPLLKHNNQNYETDREKCDLFSLTLADTFKPNTERTDDEFTAHVDEFVRNRTKNIKKPKFNKITINELTQAIKKTKSETSPGLDKISNLMIQKLQAKSLDRLLSIFNKSVEEGIVPSEAKISTITMIPKKTDDPNSPTNYRPISLTSCLVKLLERIMCNRLYKFLCKNNILIEEQSGFRRNRRTADNLYYLTQKVAESFNRGKRALCIFFDICKAFDKVWHNGLIYKLAKANVPDYLINWIQNFLTNRKFCVNVNGEVSELREIEAGVPQGSVLSPLLFSIFINDIPIRKNPNGSQSTLFADDLASTFFFKKKGIVENQIKKYLLDLELWLTKWKMKMAAHKCNYILFSKNKKNDPNFELKLFGEKINQIPSAKFLGLTFDSHLNFSANVEEIKSKCVNRLNIIKILSNRKWNLKKQTLLNLYKSLIGSVLDYSFPTINNITPDILSKMQAVQNRAVRVIFKKYTDSNEEVENFSEKIGLMSVANRLSELNEKYVVACLDSDNPLITRLIKEYGNGFQSRTENRSTPLSNIDIDFTNL
jgi:hypothetical protein